MSKIRKTKKSWKKIETYMQINELIKFHANNDVIFDFRFMNVRHISIVKMFRITRTDISNWNKFNKAFQNGFKLWMHGIDKKKNYQWTRFISHVKKIDL